MYTHIDISIGVKVRRIHGRFTVEKHCDPNHPQSLVIFIRTLHSGHPDKEKYDDQWNEPSEKMLHT